jgi:hypothetical protein
MDMRFPNRAHTTAASGFTTNPTLLPLYNQPASSGHNLDVHFQMNWMVQFSECMHEQVQLLKSMHEQVQLLKSMHEQVQLLKSMHEQQQRNQPPRYQLFVVTMGSIAEIVGTAFDIITHFM